MERNRKKLNMDIKTIRKRWGLTQRQFAKRLGVSWSLVQKWEQGTREPMPYHKILIRTLDEK